MENQSVNSQIYELKKEVQRQEQKKIEKRQAIKKWAMWVIGGGLAIALIGGIIWYIATRPPIPEGDIISKNGFHWHPELTIYVKGVKQEIPENIGLPAGMNAIHQPIHTHDDSDKGIVHMEFGGRVLKQNTTLGQFFKNWGKDIRSFGANMKMKVNGQENTDYENYMMQDKDNIELYYEKLVNI